MCFRMKKLCKMETYADGNGDSMKFTKMHGIGNDYVYVNCFTEQVRDPEQVSCRISDRFRRPCADQAVICGRF